MLANWRSDTPDFCVSIWSGLQEKAEPSCGSYRYLVEVKISPRPLRRPICDYPAQTQPREFYRAVGRAWIRLARLIDRTERPASLTSPQQNPR